jgi:superfamily II DNA or RNA helicase
MQIVLNPSSIESYQTFLKIKSLPRYQIHGHLATFPDEYASFIVGSKTVESSGLDYEPLDCLFDYQRDITALALRKKKFAVFAECGLGKSLIEFEFAKHLLKEIPGKGILLVTPLQVVRQMTEEIERFYGSSLPYQVIKARDLADWTKNGKGFAITNWEALTDDIQQGNLGALIADESSLFKSAYGKWAQIMIRLGKGIDYKLALTGTPAPNDRIEYGNHAVFLDVFPTLNSFYAKFFVNRGQTQNRWEMRPHAIKPFFRSLSHWCIFLQNPATYGWVDNTDPLPPIDIHIHDVPLTDDQRTAFQGLTGQIIAGNAGGIVNRSKLSQIAKGKLGKLKLTTNKPAFIKRLVDSWPEESTIIWCVYNEEQSDLEKIFPDAASISGATKQSKRDELIDDFKKGRRKVLISKGEILGFGMNLQIATKMIFSSVTDSYEEYWQCIKRANRYGSRKPLGVHIPVTEIEQEMLDNVLRKAKRVQADTEEQEALFREMQLLG